MQTLAKSAQLTWSQATLACFCPSGRLILLEFKRTRVRLNSLTSSEQIETRAMRLQIKSLIASAAMVLAGTQATQAVDLLWEWTTNQGGAISTGTFITNGGPFTSSNPANGTYTISQFEVKTSTAGGTIGSTLNGVYTIDNPTSGFIWSSASARPTQFFRQGGVLTNGSNFIENQSLLYWGFYLFNNQAYGGWDLDNGAAGLMTLQAVNPVPEPSTYALCAIATGVLAAAARRRKAKKA